MGAKNFLPRFNAPSGTNPDIGSNTLTIHGEGSFGQGQNLTARWGTIFANQGNFTGNLSIGQGSLSTDSTSTTNQITFGDDFYIGQNNSDNTLSIGTGTNVSTNTVLTLTSGGVQSNNITASASLNAPTFFPTTAGFIQYEGTDDEHETTLVFADPTGDRIIVFPDASGTLAFTSDITGTVDTSGSPVDDDFAKFTDANTIEGRSIAETKSDLSLDNVENKSSATIRGEIVSGDIPNNAADTSGQAGTVATISGLAPNTATTQATQPNITTMTGFVTGSANQLITDDGDGTVTSESNLTFDGDDLNVTSSSGSRPKLTITNTNVSSKGPNLFLVNDKGAAGALNDEAGTVKFKSDNASQTLISYGSITVKAIGVIPGDESGNLVLSTASSNGTTSNLRNIITGTGSVSSDTVNVDIGYGTGSATTIAGTLRIDGDSVITAGNLTFTPGGTLELDSTGDMTLDSSANIELNADGGDIDFKDGSAQLAKISSAGLSFVDNTGAGIIFEGDTDDAHQTTLTAADTTSSDKTITLPDATGTVQLQGTSAGKQLQVYFQNFGDDLGTIKHYLPFKDINEQTLIYQEEAAVVAPADGRVVSVTIRSSTLEGSGNRTIGIHTIGPNTTQFVNSNWTEEETETLAYSSSDDQHVHHFAFSNAKHFESGELFVISIQDDADLSTGFRFTYVTTVVEWDYSTWLGSTSLETDTAI